MRIRGYHFIILLFFILISPLNLQASDANFDFTNSVIVTPRKLEKLEFKAITVLREEIQKRTGIQLDTVTKWPKNQQSVIAVGQKEQMKFFAGPYSDIFENGQTLHKEGFRLLMKENAILVVGNDPRGVFYGIGKLLRNLYMKTGSIVAPKKIRHHHLPSICYSRAPTGIPAQDKCL